MKEKMNEKLMPKLVSVVEEEIDNACIFMDSHGFLWYNGEIERSLTQSAYSLKRSIPLSFLFVSPMSIA